MKTEMAFRHLCFCIPPNGKTVRYAYDLFDRTTAETYTVRLRNDYLPILPEIRRASLCLAEGCLFSNLGLFVKQLLSQIQLN